MRKTDFYVTNGALHDQRISELLVMKMQGIENFTAAIDPPSSNRSLLPVVPTGAMRHDTLYPSGKAENAPFYMPQYEVQRTWGSPNISLKRRADNDDPTQPVGELMIRLDRLPWVQPGVKAEAVDHVLSGSIAYHVPVEDAGFALNLEPDHPENFEDTFSAVDPTAQGITHIEGLMIGGGAFKFVVHRRNGVDVRELPTASGFGHNGEVQVALQDNDEAVDLTLRIVGAYLLVTERVQSSDRQTMYYRDHLMQRARVGVPSALSNYPLAPFVSHGEKTQVSVTQILTDEDYARLWRIMTDPSHAARLHLDQTATVARRDIGRNFIGTGIAAKLDALQMSTVMMKPDMSELRADASLTAAAISRFTEVARVAAPAREIVAPQPRDLTSHIALEALTAIGRRGFEADAFISAEMSATRVPGGLRATEVLADAAVAHRDGFQVVVPVDVDGTPALSERRETSVDIIAPFWFDPVRLAGRFDEPPQDTDALRLLRHEVRAAGRTAVFYQDALNPAAITYEPEAFTLSRSAQAPYEPQVLFLLDEAALDDDGQPTQNVTMTYHVSPVLHPQLLDAARDTFGPDALIAPVAPAVSRLVLFLPVSPSGVADPIERTGVEVDFADGLTDTIQLSDAQYHQLVAGFQTVDGAGLVGHVDLTLPDGRTGQVPVEIGLRDGFDLALDVEPDQGTNHGFIDLHIRNRIESPVRVLPDPITGPDGVRITPDVPAGGTAIAAGELGHFECGVTPPSVLSPLVLIPPHTVIEPDILAILSQTVVVQGYQDDLFDITVSVEPMFFDFVPAGLDPLTALEVRFRTLQDPVVLTPAQPSKSVTLMMPKLLFLTNSDAAQHYSYSVTNMHANGAGAVGPYTAGQGNLSVQPVSALS